MFEIAEFLIPFYKEVMTQSALFLESRGATTEQLSVAPAGMATRSGTVMTLRYDSERYNDNNYIARTTIVTRSGIIEFRSGLRTALNFAEDLFDDPQNIEELRMFNTSLSVRDAAQALGLDANDLETQGVKAITAGSHVTMTNTGALLFIVEDRGETYPIADSPTPAILVYLVHSSKREMMADVAGRSAKLYARWRDSN